MPFQDLESKQDLFVQVLLRGQIYGPGTGAGCLSPKGSSFLLLLDSAYKVFGVRLAKY